LSVLEALHLLIVSQLIELTLDLGGFMRSPGESRGCC